MYRSTLTRCLAFLNQRGRGFELSSKLVLGYSEAGNFESAAIAKIPNTAELVVIGGGIVGCFIAYHLAHMGRTDVLLFEQNQLTSATTSACRDQNQEVSWRA